MKFACRNVEGRKRSRKKKKNNNKKNAKEAAMT